ncbi:MAG: hypothetical protein GWO24_16840, partial [Akkermansiaceae bacterium]|nr:hypothetical protein [Akkermansiaceae bacterium]
MRSIFLALTIIAAYAYLRGWATDLPPVLRFCFAVDLHPVLRSCIAVLVLVLGIGWWRKRERPACSEAPSVRPARWPDYLAIGLGVLAVECLFLFFLSAAPPRAESLASRFDEFVRPERAATDLRGPAPGNDAGDDTISGNWLWNGQGKRSLPLRTNATPSNKPEVFFRPADSGTTGHLLRRRPYIRAFAMEHFEDSTWSPLTMEAETLTADGDGWVAVPEPPARPGPVLRGEIFHSTHPAGQNVFTALQGATRARLPELRKVAPGIYRLNPLTNPGRGYNYEVVSKTVTFSSLLERGALESFLVPEEVPEHLVELPDNEELRQVLIDIAIRTQGPIESRLLSLRKFLRQNYDYSLQVENRDQ